MKPLYVPKDNSLNAKLFPWIGSLVLLPVMIYFTLNIGNFLFIDYINLLIHEGGHGVFKVFGGFIYTLGGSLMQIIIPSMFIVFYFVKKTKFGTQAFLVWLGQNLFNISVYAADARAHKLPLLGGNKVYHDWTYLLNKLGLIEYDQLIGNIFVLLGLVAFVVVLMVPFLIKNEKSVELNLNI
ncbi:MAG: hypothetical protein FD122_63 [Stygiobacter sp.]|nr:MAG: hypothetical protein FD122_63 [Stygiobacter sp.]KAF0217178.1 MAG: hypothetical protein FD178_714 [Ignavibacteria bacterium]